MKRRASLATLMGLVAVLAVGLAAMKVATEQTSRLVFGFGLMTLLVATLGTLVRRQGRAQWIGFALFGWAYALVFLVPSLRDGVAAELPGDEVLTEIVDLIQPPLSKPVEPLGQPPSTHLDKMDAGGWHFTKNGQIVDLTSEEWKPWAVYLDRLNAHDDRVEAAKQARRIALIFLGQAFAVLGAAVGHALSDRAETTVASPVAPASNLPG